MTDEEKRMLLEMEQLREMEQRQMQMFAWTMVIAVPLLFAIGLFILFKG